MSFDCSIPNLKSDQEIGKIYNHQPENFTKYLLEMRFSDGCTQKIDIHNSDDIEMMLKSALDHINRTHTPVKIYFDRSTSDSELKVRMEHFQKSTFSEGLQFNISQQSNHTIVIKPKPIKVQDLGYGKNPIFLCKWYY